MSERAVLLNDVGESVPYNFAEWFIKQNKLSSSLAGGSWSEYKAEKKIRKIVDREY